MGASDKLGTLWEYERHTAAKHAILRGYLAAWFPILASIKNAKRIRFIDGFAGPGEYKGGEAGSPAIAMRIALEHRAKFTVPVHLVFIEADAARHAHLCGVVERVRAEFPDPTNRIEIRNPVHGTCSEKIDAVLTRAEREHSEFGPALVFLDQFGYSDVPMALIARIMAQSRCEVFTYVHVEGMTRFLGAGAIDVPMKRAYGDERWRRALEVQTPERARVLAEEYEAALRANAGAKYVWRFAMHGADDRLIYWLFFCTNERKGLEKMKQSMNEVDTSGGYFSFSDAHAPGQMVIFDRATEEWLASHLIGHYAGRDVSVEELEEHVVVATPLVSCRRVLAALERSGHLTVPNPPDGRRRSSFKHPTMILRFGGSLAVPE